MADLLIKHLAEKAEGHSALEMLVNQWGFDEKLIPKALQSIGSLFPHYSRHDESHSKQILINIERLLGDNISKLTATDTWLILEAAYWHDIGMVVPQKDIITAFNDEDFHRYVNEVRNLPNHDLNKFCLKFDTKDINNCFRGADTPLDAVDKFRQLMAEWFRRKHAERADAIVQAPWESVGLSSPRTELIPTRLFKLLGRVCHMHGLSFHNIIAPDGLPYREAGLAQEDCHPRFVACLLRMGDLLDLDDNRFCPVMQGISGDNRPQLSKAHEDKHSAMRHLRVDRERIEISAECETVDGYLETYKWFGWLKNEIHNQMSHWQDIVPSREFGLLPTLGEIQVKLSGEQQLLSEGEKPQFSIDGEQAIALLQGSNLYKSKFACIRELLQNAVDATLLKLSLTNNNIDWDSPLSDDVKKEFASHPVEISLVEVEQEDIPKGKTAWKLTIKDQGTGISQEDLSFMLKIGGSRKNTKRQEAISKMSEWMKPSGVFGIGFQSAYMIADKVTLTTKSIYTNDKIQINMHSPTSNKEGLVTIKSLDDGFAQEFGTELKMMFLLDKKSSSWSISFDRDRTLSEQLVDNFDPFLDDAFPFEATSLVEEMTMFSKYSLIPIKIQFKRNNQKVLTNDLLPPQTGNTDWNYIEVNEQQVLLTYKTKVGATNILDAYYRGQPVEHKTRLFDHVYVGINLLSGKAGAWLTINRDELLGSATGKLQELVSEALKKQISDDLGKSDFIDKLEDDQKSSLSYFLKTMALYDNSWKVLSDKLDSDWLSLSFNSNSKISCADLLKKEEWILATKVDDYQLFDTDTDIIENEKCDLLLPSSSREMSSSQRSDITKILIDEWLNTSGHTVKILGSDYYKDKVMRFKYKFSSHESSYSDEALATALIKGEGSYNCRYLLPIEENKWDILALKKTAVLSGAHYLFPMLSPENKGYILLPFLFRTHSTLPRELRINRIEVSSKQLDQIVTKVLPKLKKEDATFEEIKKEYEKLIKYIDEDVMSKSPFSAEWKVRRGLVGSTS